MKAVFSNMFRVLQPAPFVEPIEDEKVMNKQYRYWRIRIFYSMFIGYAFYYFTRKSFTFAMPAMINDLGMTKSQLGILASLLYITYGVSKFVSGIMGDRSNPRYFMAIGLILTGIINIFFGMSSTVFAFAVLWGLNGWFQGYGWPPAARLLTHWYSQKERGTWWAVWSTSHNVGGALIPLLVAFCVAAWGWRYAMYIPGVLCIIMGLFLINRLRDTPQSLGLPSIEEFKNDYSNQDVSKNGEHEFSLKERLVQYVLKNKFIWLLGVSYFFVYVVRTAINDWTILYLQEVKHYTAVQSATMLSLFEVGGFLGMLVAGWASDYIFKGRRIPIMILYMVAILAPLWAVWALPGALVWLDGACLFTIGFFIFGPQMLIGCSAADFSHKKAVATATGFVGCFAYLGAAFAGYPLGILMQSKGWEGYFMILIAFSIATILLMIPMWSAKSASVKAKSLVKKEEKEVGYA